MLHGCILMLHVTFLVFLSNTGDNSDNVTKNFVFKGAINSKLTILNFTISLLKPQPSKLLNILTLLGSCSVV